jgi:hypothetical protein
MEKEPKSAIRESIAGTGDRIGRPDEIPLTETDPIQELFGPGSGTFRSPEDDDSAPDELISVFDEYGLSDLKYKCVLKEVGISAEKNFIRSFVESYPSVDWITQNCGPGEYLLVFTWRQEDSATGKMKGKIKQIKIAISEKCRDDFLDYQRKKKIKSAQQARQDIAQANLDKILDSNINTIDMNPNTPAVIDPMEAGKKYVQNITEAAKMLGLDRNAPAAPGLDWGKVLGVIVPLIPPLLDFMGKQADRSEQRMKEFIALITATTASSQNQMLEIMKTTSGSNAGSRAVEEFKTMLNGVIDIKSEISGMGKKSVADRIFELLEGIAPHVAALLSMPRNQAMNDPRVRAAQVYASLSPDIKDIKNDLEEQTRLVNDMDAYYGWENTDGILQIMKLFERPDTCPRRADQRYPHDDPRNTIVNASQEAQEAPGLKQEAGGGQKEGEEFET